MLPEDSTATGSSLENFLNDRTGLTFKVETISSTDPNRSNALQALCAGTPTFGWVDGWTLLAAQMENCAAPVLKRFSTLSLSCVSILAGSGISNSWLLVGSIPALFTTRYGWLLLFKLTLFGILVGLGTRNRFVIKAKLINAPTSSGLLTQLRRNVICEACLALTVVVIVACLGITPPARHP